MVHIYPVTKTLLSCSSYSVKVNGIEASPDAARVSAMPFNRRWPGHQRSKDQSEVINFLSLSADEPVKFEITPEKPFENAVIRPLSLGITPVCENGKITFTLPHPAYFTVEPFGRNGALHIFVDPPEKKPLRDESFLFFGAGEHHVGEIVLKDGQTLYLDEGAVVYACVYACDAKNISILGRGILDNSENVEKILFEANEENNSAAVSNAVRKHTVQLEYCVGVTIDGITIRDSLVYNIRPIACENIHISNVKIIGCWRYNSDGIDMHNCKNTVIENCFIRTFDDSVCVKGFDCYYDGDVEKAVFEAMHHNGKCHDTFENITVRDCVIWNDWGKCLEIGAETRAEEIFGAVFENCNIIHVCGTVLDCCNVDYADVHDIVYRNITVEYDDCIPSPEIQRSDREIYNAENRDFAPCIIGATVSYHPEYSAGGSRRGKNRNLTFEKIKLFGRQRPAFFFAGIDAEHSVSDVTIRDFTVNGLPLGDDFTIGIDSSCGEIKIEETERE